MRLLVYPHDLAIGGSQINAIDLAAGVAAAGHEVCVYGIPGPLVAYVEERGLRFIPARPMRYRPAPSRIAQLTAIARRERIDLIHAYEWPPCLDAYYGATLLAGVPLLCTVLGMTVMPAVPPSVPLIMGTEELGHLARRVQRGGVWVIEPPIDAERDHPAIDGTPFRKALGIAEGDALVVTVSRLALDMKLDALVRAIDAAAILAQRRRVRLAIVGDGPAYPSLLARARSVNERCGREVVTLCGATLDPRAAYAAADLVVGMGSSALRAMAIGRPVIVQGERGFSDTFEPATLDMFLYQGFYGFADGAPDANRLAAQMERLLVDDTLRAELGLFGRRIVVERFSLQRAVGLQLAIYDEVLRRPVRRSLPDALRAGLCAASIEVGNHDPRRKRDRRVRSAAMLAAARAGSWPPEGVA